MPTTRESLTKGTEVYFVQVVRWSEPLETPELHKRTIVGGGPLQVHISGEDGVTHWKKYDAAKHFSLTEKDAWAAAEKEAAGLNRKAVDQANASEKALALIRSKLEGSHLKSDSREG